jgi:hypothetical protein
MVQFDRLVIAVAAQRVARIALTDEVVAVPARAVPSVDSVQIGGAVLPAWDLGKLLGLGGAPAAWLVVMTSDDPAAPRIALGTGPCIAIASHGQISTLPAGVVSAPAAAVEGVFATAAALRERGVGPLGVRVDPMCLIGASALATALRGDR